MIVLVLEEMPWSTDSDGATIEYGACQERVPSAQLPANSVVSSEHTLSVTVGQHDRSEDAKRRRV